jgi:DNA-binding transcriptional regulator YhcF (GntR family)
MQTQKETIIPELLSLNDLALFYGLNPKTILRERWEQKKILQRKGTYKGKDGKKKTVHPHNTSGFGFTTPAVLNGRKVQYRKEDVEKWIADNLEDLSPEEKISKVS